MTTTTIPASLIHRYGLALGTTYDFTNPLIGLPVTVRYEYGDETYRTAGTFVATVDDESIWVIETTDGDEKWVLPETVDVVDFFGDVPVADLPTDYDESDDGWLDI